MKQLNKDGMKMAKLTVRYTVEVEQDLDWDDDEIHNLDYENLLLNLDIEAAHEVQHGDILSMTKDGLDFNF